jgi:hypothetical protein
MLVKVQFIENGVAKEMIFDASKDWMAVKFTQEELQILSHHNVSDVFIAAPLAQLMSNKAAVRKFAQDWPQRYWSGTHRPPAGGLLLPDNIVKDQDKS